MTKVIVVLNTGSSSVKFSVFSVGDEGLVRLYRGELEGIGTAPHFFARDVDGEIVADERESVTEVASQEDAVHRIYVWLEAHRAGHEVAAVGHRVVHGGPVFYEPVVVDDRVLEVLTGFEPFAPSHQPHNLAPIRAVPVPTRADSGGLLRYRVPPDRPPGCRCVRAAPRISGRRRAPLRLSWAVV